MRFLMLLAAAVLPLPGPLGAGLRAQGRVVEGQRLRPVVRPSERRSRSLREERVYRSPDGRYLARLRHDDGDTWNLAVTARGSQHALAATDDVQALVWVPRRPHRLVVAARGVYGRALLGLWDGRGHWRQLVAVKRPSEECFTLYGVTADGRRIVYGHDPDINSSGRRRNALGRRRWLRLPPYREAPAAAAATGRRQAARPPFWRARA